MCTATKAYAQMDSNLNTYWESKPGTKKTYATKIVFGVFESVY